MLFQKVWTSIGLVEVEVEENYHGSAIGAEEYQFEETGQIVATAN